jgi:general secretion pathway protein G
MKNVLEFFERTPARIPALGRWAREDSTSRTMLQRAQKEEHKRKKRQAKERTAAFTLVEVLLVLVILVIIGSIAVTAYGPIQRRAYINAARSQIKAFKTPLNAYQLDIGDYPSTVQGLQALRYPPPDLPDPSRWNGPYLDSEVPLDPWGNPYQYEYPGRYDPAQPDIWSFGPDGINGTDDDIGSWQQ